MSRTNWILLGLVVVLGVLAYRVALRDPVAAERTYHPIDIDVETVTGLEIRNEHGRMVLERRESVWSLISPVRYPANTLKVASLVANLASIRTEAPLPRGKTPEAERKRAGLDRDVAHFTIHAPGRTVAGVVGRPPKVGERTYLVVDGRDGVFTLVSRVAREFFEPADRFRDPRALRVDLLDLVELRYGWPDRRLVLRQEAPGFWVLARPDQGPVHPDALARVFRNLAGLEVQRWPGDAAGVRGAKERRPVEAKGDRISDGGAAARTLEAIGKVEGERRIASLRIGANVGSGLVAAMSSPPPARIELDCEEVNRVFAVRVEDLRDTAVLRFQEESLRSVVVQWPDRAAVRLERNADGWMRYGEDGPTPVQGREVAWLHELLSALNRDTIVRFFPVEGREDSHGMRALRLSLEIRFRGTRPDASIRFGGEQNGVLQVRRDEEASVLGVSWSDWETVLAR